jgi:hypothetical protein
MLSFPKDYDCLVAAFAFSLEELQYSIFTACVYIGFRIEILGESFPRVEEKWGANGRSAEGLCEGNGTLRGVRTVFIL